MNIDNNFEHIAKKFRVNADCLAKYLKLVKPERALLEKAFNLLDHQDGFRMIAYNLAPKDYLFDHTWLLGYLYKFNDKDVKGLPSEVFKAHLEQLKFSDSIDNTSRRAPYDSYDSDAFTALRFATKKSDVDFVIKMFSRSISHSSYPAAREKLREMATNFTPLI